MGAEQREGAVKSHRYWEQEIERDWFFLKSASLGTAAITNRATRLGASPEPISWKKAALETTYSLLRWETELLKPGHEERLHSAPWPNRTQAQIPTHPSVATETKAAVDLVTYRRVCISLCQHFSVAGLLLSCPSWDRLLTGVSPTERCQMCPLWVWLLTICILSIIPTQPLAARAEPSPKLQK